MHRDTRLELLGFCSPFGQFNGVPPTSLGGGWPRTLSFLGMPTVLVGAVCSHNLLPRDEIVDVRCLFYTDRNISSRNKMHWSQSPKRRLSDVIQSDPMVRGLGPRNHPLVNFKIWLPTRNITGTYEKRFFIKKTTKPKLTLTDEFSPVAPAPKGSALQSCRLNTADATNDGGKLSCTKPLRSVVDSSPMSSLTFRSTCMKCEKRFLTIMYTASSSANNATTTIITTAQTGNDPARSQKIILKYHN